MQKKSAVMAVLVLLGVSLVMAGCPRPHRYRPHIPRPHHLFQPQLPLSSTLSFIQAEAKLARFVRIFTDLARDSA